MKIYLDDERKCPNGWVLTKTATTAIWLLKNNKVTEISLDHDLGLDDETGNDVILWIEKMVYTTDYIPPKIHIHTANSSARVKMELAKKSIERKRKWAE